MTISKLTNAAGIAKGSFYSFFEFEEDFVWIKAHMKDAKPFEPKVLVHTIQTFFQYVSDVRADIDIGIVVNLIKGVYGMRENRETLIETSLDNSIEIMLRALEIYISGKGDLLK